MDAATIHELRKAGVKVDPSGMVAVRFVAGQWCPYTGASLAFNEAPYIDLPVTGSTMWSTPIRVYVTPYTEQPMPIIKVIGRGGGWFKSAWEGPLPESADVDSLKRILEKKRGDNQKIPFDMLPLLYQDAVANGATLSMDKHIAEALLARHDGFGNIRRLAGMAK